MTTLRQRIERMLPARLRILRGIRREKKGLARADEAGCDLRNLRSHPAVDVHRWLTDVDVEPAWRHAAARLEALAIPDDTGGINLGDRRAIFYLLSQLGSASILEIGTHVGASTTTIAAALATSRENGGKQARLVSVDIRDVNSQVSNHGWNTACDNRPRR
ncbi:MAG: hypothetical protein HC897_14180 [Thermoanaerobaculia bacterium]|nr:hypothetical protein [Thermoanaerobaculia bacterium]